MRSPSSVFHKWGTGVSPELPRVVAAHDEFLVTDDGTEILDAAAGAAVTNLGHSVPGVEEVASEQMEEVAYISLSHFVHESAIALADRLVDLAPGDHASAFFVNSGSEATETAIKLARQFHRATGQTEKTKVIGRWQSYHGATLGSLAVSGNTNRRMPYDDLLPRWPHIPPAYPYRWPYSGSPEEQGIQAAQELERLINQEGPETVAAFIAEPVTGASIPAAHPHPAYFEEIRRICDEFDVLFIADEVMTGFGRVGPLFGIERFGVSPDMLLLGKGLSGGYAPISAVTVAGPIADIFDANGTHSFNHGHTYGGNPVSAAVADHVVQQYSPDVLAQGQEMGADLRAQLDGLTDHPNVGEIRSAGAMIGIEFVRDAETKDPFDPDLNVARRVYEAALEDDVYTYPGTGSVNGQKGDHLMLSPPLTMSDRSVERVASAVKAAVNTVFHRV